MSGHPQGISPGLDWRRLGPLVPDDHRWLYWQTMATQKTRIAFLDRLQLTAHTRWLDLGVGLGALALEGLVRHPAVLCDAVDHDPRMLTFCREAAEVLGVHGRLRLQEAEAGNLPWPDGRFDVVTARYLFQHLPHPQDAAREAFRVLAPGGRLIVVDIDDGGALTDPPPPPEAATLLEAVRAVQTGAGGDRTVGRKLAGYLADAGFQPVVARVEVRAEALPPVDTLAVAFQLERLRLEAMREPIQALLHIDDEGWLRAVDAYRAWATALRFVAVPEITVEGVRPSSPGGRGA
jgi:SAM-dependent methyltransferase